MYLIIYAYSTDYSTHQSSVIHAHSTNQSPRGVRLPPRGTYFKTLTVDEGKSSARLSAPKLCNFALTLPMKVLRPCSQMRHAGSIPGLRLDIAAASRAFSSQQFP